MSVDERDEDESTASEERLDDIDVPDGVELPDDVPEWDDEYLDRVGANLLFNFDLEKDNRVDGEQFDLTGELRMDSHKQFLTSALSYGHQRERHHLFARRVSNATVAELERLVELGHTLADDWITADEEHHGTEFTFVLVASEISDDVRAFVDGFRDRTLIKYGYYGHYEVNLAVVAPDDADAVASRNAHVATAFVLWEQEVEERGFVGRLVRRLTR